MRPLRIGLVGLGWFGRLHFEVWRNCLDARVVALCDKAGEAAVRAQSHAQDEFHKVAGGGARFDAGALPVYSDLEEMLASEDIDLIDIVTPEALHGLHAELALRAGKPVIIEKPFTTSAEDARRLVTLAREAGLAIYVGNILRFDPRYVQVINEFRADGTRPRHMSLQRHFQSSALDVYGRVHPFFGACIHDIDLAIWSQDERPQRMLGHVAADPQTGRLASATGIVEWWSGATAVIQNAWLLPAGTPAGFAFESLFMGPERSWAVRSVPIVEAIGRERSEWPEFFFWPSLGDGVGGALRDELLHFAACARAGCPSERAPLEQLLWGIETAEALLASAETGKWVDLASSE